MTTEERIKSIISEIEYDYISYDNLHGDNGQGLMVIKDALEKRIQKKPANVHKADMCFGYVLEADCPVCGATINRIASSYCGKCSQLINWSEVE